MKALIFAAAVAASQPPPPSGAPVTAPAASVTTPPEAVAPPKAVTAPKPVVAEPSEAVKPAKAVAPPDTVVPAKPVVAPPDTVAPAKPVVAPPDIVTPPVARVAAPSGGVVATPVAVDAGPQTAGPEGPVESRLDVRLDLDTVWYSKPSFDLLSTHDTSVVPGVSVGYAVLHLAPISVVPELGFSANTEDSSNLFGGAVTHTSLASKNVYGGVSLRWDLLPILDVAGRVSGGASFVHFEMQPSASSTGQLEDDAAAPFMTLGAGFTVHTPSGTLETKTGALRSLLAGLSFESGYVLGGSVDLTPAPSGDAGRIRTSYLSLGRLERSGPYIKTSLTVRF